MTREPGSNETGSAKSEAGKPVSKAQRTRLIKLMQDDEFLGLPKVLAMGGKAIPILQSLLSDSEQPYHIRHRALICLGEIADPAGYDIAAGFLNHSDPVFRIAATRAITRIDAGKAATLLADNLEDDDASVCNTKLHCLAETGHHCARHALEHFHEKTEDTFLRSAAKKSLQRLKEVERHA